jgi:hypothetical protein
MGPGPSAPTVAVVDAYDDPNAASDLAAYRTSLSLATDPNTGLTDAAIPSLCSGTTTTGCVTFTKVNQSGGTSYPTGDTGWAQEESLDLDMISAVCPDCNIVLVEANTNNLTDLATAVAYAKTLNPAAVTNSYGGGEFRGESSYNGYYSGTSGTAMTAATGDNGYGVEFPAASPGLTAVGGTSLSYSGSGTGLTWQPQTVWSGAGSGCSGRESIPSWQNDQNVYSVSADCTARQVGDVSAVADPNTGVASYDTYGQPGWLVFGGTSVSAQIIGATYGLAAGTGTLAPNPSALYPDAGTSATGATPGLVPVTSGFNYTFFSCGSYLCDASLSLSSGYNGPAGLGTPHGVRAFQTASAPVGSLSFSSAPKTITAGAASSTMTVGLSPAANGTVGVNLSSNSATGQFATSSSGPFSSTLTVNVSSGGTSASFVYKDTTAGSPVVTAAASNYTSTSQTETVTAGPLASITVSPGSATVALGGTQGYSASGKDQYGNAVAVTSVSWSVSPTTLGSFSPNPGNPTTFTASSAGSGTVTATSGAVSGTASVTVTSGSLSFSSAAQTITAGAASSTMTIGLSPAANGTVGVNLSSNSATGQFATSSSGPFSSTLTVNVSSGGSSASFVYKDTTAGSPVVTAAASNYTSASQTETVTAAALASITVSPGSATVALGGTQSYSASGRDQYGNAVSVSPTWSVSGGLGSFSPNPGNPTTFTASSAGSGTVTATSGAVSGTASVTVTGLKSMTVTVTAGTAVLKGSRWHVPLTVTAVDAQSNPISGASVILEVFAGSTCSGTAVASGTGTTGSNGRAAFTFTTGKAGTWCALATVTDSGYSTGTGQSGAFTT